MRLLSALALAILAVTPAAAQQVDITKPAPTTTRERETGPEPGVIAPGLSGETRPMDADVHPHAGRVPNEPGFIRGLSSRTATGRMGIAGWTAPSAPVGGLSASWSDHNGWFALGFSVIWDAPPPAPDRTAP